MKLAVTTLVFCVAALLALGMVMLYSSTMARSGTQLLLTQLLWGALGLIGCIAVTLMDYRWLRKIAWPLLAVAVVLLALVMLGPKINGARRWLGHGSVRLQPSELAKFALLIVLAWYGERYQRQMQTWKRGILIPGLIIAVVLGLIFVEPDRGATILLASVSGTLLLVAGVRWRFIIPPVLLGVAGLLLSLLHDSMRTNRISAWLNPEGHKSGAGYQAYEAMIALGAGGWTGLGLGNSKQKLGFVPENHTDFIFSIIGEELGLVATLLVIAAFIAIVVCGVYIALRAPDTFGLLLGTGIAFLIGLQAFINIGVVTSALPNKGLSLPFISYGGSSLITMLTSVGVLLSIARQGRATEDAFGPASARDPFARSRSKANPFRDSEPSARRA